MKRLSNLFKIKGKSEGELVDGAFDIMLVLKSLFALGEVLAGIFMFFLTPSRMNAVIRWFTRGELKEDPKDLLSNLLINFGHHFTSSAGILAAIYLLGHGLIKLVTLALLWRKILWAYPLSMLVFAGFIAFQITDIVVKHSIFMIFVTLLDVLMIILTWLEWRRMRGLWKNADKKIG